MTFLSMDNILFGEKKELTIKRKKNLNGPHMRNSVGYEVAKLVLKRISLYTSVLTSNL